MPAKQFWTDKYKNNNHKLACIFFYTAVNYELNIILRTITFFQPGMAANTIYLKTASAKNKPLSSRSVQHMFWYSKDQKPRYPQKSI